MRFIGYELWFLLDEADSLFLLIDFVIADLSSKCSKVNEINSEKSLILLKDFLIAVQGSKVN